MAERSRQDGQPVQPLEPLHSNAARTLDGTDRQNLADTTIAGVSHEHRSHGPQVTAIAAPPSRGPSSEPARGGPSPDGPRPTPPAAAPSTLPAVIVGVTVSIVVLGGVLFLLFSA